MKTRLVSTARVVENVSFNLFSVLTLPGTVLVEFSNFVRIQFIWFLTKHGQTGSDDCWMINWFWWKCCFFNTLDSQLLMLPGNKDRLTGIDG